MKGDNSFSRREWIFVIIILMLLQFIGGWMALVYGSSTSALGYVSFAGTIVSIILGLIAIIYAYVQSFTQANSVVEIREQIAKLIMAGDDIVKSKEEIHRSALKLSQITEGLSSRVGENTAAAQEFAGSVDKLASALGSKELMDGSEVVQSSGAVGGGEGLTVLNSSRVWLALMVLAFSEGVKRKYTLDQVKDSLVIPVGRKLGYSEELMSGMFIVFLFVLEAEGFLTITEKAAGRLGVDIECEKDFVDKASEVFSRSKTKHLKELAEFWSVVDALV